MVFDEIYDNEGEYLGREFHSKNYFAPRGVHIMNKNEKKALRKLKKKTGMSEKELRLEKTNRKILSNAQTAKGIKDTPDRAIMMFMKKVLRELKLPAEHPDVRDAAHKELNDQYSYLYRQLRTGFATLSGRSVVARYLQLRKQQKTK